MRPEVMTFDDCLEIAKGKKHLVLGNGFSISLFNEIFNYVRLAEKIKDLRIIKLFKDINTTDFEYVMYKLIETIKIASIYDCENEIINEMKLDEENLKKILISVITKHHPENPSAISDRQYQSCYQFLKHFEEGKKYSFNYDLLLYWVYMHFLDDKKNNLTLDDGFRKAKDNEQIVTWEIGREHRQNLYYLHGAIHIFKGSNSLIEKYTWINTNKTIGDQVRDSIENDKIPIFISEGSTTHKLKRIKDNGYLARSFSSLHGITRNLFFFGHSLRDEDDHVLDIINENKGIKNIFISLYGNLENTKNQYIINKVSSWKSKYNIRDRKYILYDASSANVWGR